ncbi:MAG TPA: type II toxin-antitoxin system RelE/ParE family toxin [Acidobacteriaceae bacterium]|nr:type II toxin-antitoxin system RelE/ParE family toxin [Acidobacteriaceae bacterium]
MIELRWTNAAVTDLERIADYLFEQTPEHASRIVRAIYDAPLKLREFPGLGRPGKVDGTRELILTSLPYLLVYVQAGDIIHLVRILHGAQKWP